jgi:hypothetical protein
MYARLRVYLFWRFEGGPFLTIEQSLSLELRKHGLIDPKKTYKRFSIALHKLSIWFAWPIDIQERNCSIAWSKKACWMNMRIPWLVWDLKRGVRAKNSLSQDPLDLCARFMDTAFRKKCRRDVEVFMRCYRVSCSRDVIATVVTAQRQLMQRTHKISIDRWSRKYEFKS